MNPLCAANYEPSCHPVVMFKRDAGESAPLVRLPGANPLTPEKGPAHDWPEMRQHSGKHVPHITKALPGERPGANIMRVHRNTTHNLRHDWLSFTADKESIGVSLLACRNEICVDVIRNGERFVHYYKPDELAALLHRDMRKKP